MNNTVEARKTALLEIRKHLRIVVLDCAYNSISDPLTQDFLGKIAEFKINAYLDDWTYGVLPVDSGDFVGTHLMLCLENNGELEILAGFKILTHDRCRMFRMEFSAFHALDGTKGTEGHRKAIQNVINEADQKLQSVGYFCSWAVRPDAKKSRFLARYCRDITTALIVQGAIEFKIPKAIAFAVQRLKVDRYHESMGLKPLLLDGQPLNAFHSEAYMNEVLTTSLLKNDEFSEEAKALAAEYADLWDNRLIIGTAVDEMSKKAA